jgi:sarcosine oxidase subunit beta
MGASLDPYELHGTRSTLDFVEGLTTHMLEMFPFLSNVKVMRQWAGMADMTPTSPRSWARPRWKASTWIPAGAPGASRPRRCAARPWPTPWSMTPHPLITGFSLDRFRNYALTGEKGAASVGH